MPARTVGERLGFALRCAAMLVLISAGALWMLLVACLTGFALRRFYSERILAPIGHLALGLWGIHVRKRQAAPFPAGQTVYIANHTSTLDMFVLIALGMPNTRFFLSGYLRKLLPFGVIGYLTGIFWTMPQTMPERRRRLFAGAAETLRRTGESVFLSPEGVRVTGGQIGHFNKGAFHLAASLKAPIVPMFILIPAAVDPGLGLHVRPGVIDVHVGPAIPTVDWCLADLAEHIASVRAAYVQWNTDLRGTA
ncbi:lysophospholipid acyltransferase family protein [Massilia glaciei]|uniref:1-acyl-sn-glycerol-3-phosphate acyltransferase n=1 Tax=Massilia glaciei TaxID=1524097 RepID=A0A2U2HGM4_9BURK|nr:lysophospholipid acyltransferase family protein [Massilia glaciei]PWF44343.1 1-acyl-sn-glycerol-3-phosphate acyltransferase [Massilia glaciei]